MKTWDNIGRVAIKICILPVGIYFDLNGKALRLKTFGVRKIWYWKMFWDVFSTENIKIKHHDEMKMLMLNQKQFFYYISIKNFPQFSEKLFNFGGAKGA